MDCPEPQLNEGQAKAAEEIFNFLFTEDKGHILSGPGGVGKTFLLNLLIKKYIPRYYDSCKIVGMDPLFTSHELCATTNKATTVLQESTGEEARTIHSLFGLVVRQDYKTGKTFLSATKNSQEIFDTLVIVDESSMLDMTMCNFMGQFAGNCKFLFVGDIYQLPPVDEEISQVYNQNFNVSHLTHVVRNEGRFHLQAVCQQLRDTVGNKIFLPIHTDHEEVVELHSDAEVMETLKKMFTIPNEFNSVLCYTNKRVALFNKLVRTQILHLPEEYVLGEKLITNNPVVDMNEKNCKIVLPTETLVTITNIIGSGIHMVDEEKIPYISYEVTMYFGDKLPRIINVPESFAFVKSQAKKLRRAQRYDEAIFLDRFFANVRPSYASTVHKSQGSTYDNVMIDLEDISTNFKRNEVARLLYVAFTRPKKTAYLYGKLDPKYGGVISAPVS